MCINDFGVIALYIFSHAEDTEEKQTQKSKNNASYEGFYDIIEGYPQNPLGRTGIFGRGHLQKLGPNFKSIPIFTRFKDPELAPKLDSPLEVLVHFPNPSQPHQYNLPELDSYPDEPLTVSFVRMLFQSIPNTNSMAKMNLKRILKR